MLKKDAPAANAVKRMPLARSFMVFIPPKMLKRTARYSPQNPPLAACGPTRSRGFSPASSAPAMKKQAAAAKSKKLDKKARALTAPSSLDMGELQRSVGILQREPPVPVTLRLDGFRARLDTIPCTVCKEWALFAWSKWLQRDAEVASRPWFSDLAYAYQQADVVFATSGTLRCTCFPCVDLAWKHAIPPRDSVQLRNAPREFGLMRS